MHAREGEQTRITGSRLANEFEFAACFSLVTKRLKTELFSRSYPTTYYLVLFIAGSYFHTFSFKVS